MKITEQQRTAIDNIVKKHNEYRPEILQVRQLSNSLFEFRHLDRTSDIVRITESGVVSEPKTNMVYSE